MNWGRMAGFIILAYIVFTTMKGNLRKWLQIIGLKPDGETTSEKGLSGVLKGGSIFDVPEIDLRGRSQ